MTTLIEAAIEASLLHREHRATQIELPLIDIIWAEFEPKTYPYSQADLMAIVSELLFSEEEYPHVGLANWFLSEGYLLSKLKNVELTEDSDECVGGCELTLDDIDPGRCHRPHVSSVGPISWRLFSDRTLDCMTRAAGTLDPDAEPPSYLIVPELIPGFFVTRRLRLKDEFVKENIIGNGALKKAPTVGFVCQLCGQVHADSPAVEHVDSCQNPECLSHYHETGHFEALVTASQLAGGHTVCGVGSTVADALKNLVEQHPPALFAEPTLRWCEDALA